MSRDRRLPLSIRAQADATSPLRLQTIQVQNQISPAVIGGPDGCLAKDFTHSHPYCMGLCTSPLQTDTGLLTSQMILQSHIQCPMAILLEQGNCQNPAAAAAAAANSAAAAVVIVMLTSNH